MAQACRSRLGFERQGPVPHGRPALGWLLICDPEQTFGQLAELLQASKGSIGAATKFLVPGGLVERISRRGKRRDYYRCRPGARAELARDQSRLTDDFRKLAQRGLELLTDVPATRHERQEQDQRGGTGHD
jgi:DNA-binding transcriptional regulator GbsR (MarR family)